MSTRNEGATWRIAAKRVPHGWDVKGNERIRTYVKQRVTRIVTSGPSDV
jgi:hypothetical protein